MGKCVGVPTGKSAGGPGLVVAVLAAALTLVPGVARPEPASTRVFVSGSLVNLREKPFPTASVVKQVPIATECAVEEKADSGWWRIRCADSQGWTKSELLSAEQPTFEPLLALSGDSKLPLKDRFDSVVRAVALNPKHPGARTRLWELFVEQERGQVENLLADATAPRPLAHLAAACKGEETSAESCFRSVMRRHTGAGYIEWHRLHLENSEGVGKRLFVSVAFQAFYGSKQPKQLWVHSGTVEGDAKKLDIQVLTLSRYVPSDTLRMALEPEHPREQPQLPELSEYKFVLTEEELLMLRPLAGEWLKLEQQGQQLVRLDACTYKPGAIELTVRESTASVYFTIGHDPYTREVAGVQRARDGAILLRHWYGSLNHAATKGKRRVSQWTSSEDEHITGVYVYETDAKHFRSVKASDCEGVE
ncbi:MAG: hypothetical protein JXB05_21385 [Myxococcaceae bacterium]|nr:hypothetical protein [Myxococcaceae bacterium]